MVWMLEAGVAAIVGSSSMSEPRISYLMTYPIKLRCILLLVLLFLTSFLPSASSLLQSSSSHTSNHAVIVSSSRYWFNYRHAINALSIYQILRENGIPDTNIVLMVADEYATNGRNPLKNAMYANNRHLSLYNESVEIDYRGDDVTVEQLVRVLTGTQRCDGETVLQSDAESNVLLYLTGHGGDQFFKFQDFEEIMAAQLADVIRFMQQNGKFRELLVVADTCQAFTLGDTMGDIPNVTMIGSSLKGENSYAHHSDEVLGLSVTEKYTYALSDYIARHGLGMSLQQGMVDPYSYAAQRAHVGYRDDGAIRKIDQVRMADFFANVAAPPPQSDIWQGLGETVTHMQPPPRGDRNLVSAQTTEPPKQCTVNRAAWTGMEPSNPAFVAIVVLFLGTTVWTTRQR